MRFATFDFSVRDAAFIQHVLDDPRAWDTKFLLVKEKPDILVRRVPKASIASLFPDQPHLHGLSVCDRRSKPIRIYICAENWASAPLTSRYKTLQAYRTYLVLHEFGHALGRGHAECPKRGEPAPVMMQQTLGTGECYPDPWVKKH